MEPVKYHPALIALHWLIAVMLILALAMGTLVLAETPNNDPAKIGALKGHMIFGVVLGLLTIVRFVVRSATPKPPHASTGDSMLDKLSHVVHMLLYVGVIAMAASGMATSVAAGLPDIVFGNSGVPLPKDFSEFAPRMVHGAVASLLMFLIILHFAGALYHQVILKDNLMQRMKFGRKKL